MNFRLRKIFFMAALLGLTHQSVSGVPAQHIIGVWHLKDYGYGHYGYSQLGFTADGRKCVVTVDMDKNGLPTTHYYTNTWKIEGNTLVTTVGSNPGSGLPAGYIIVDEILTLDKEHMDLIMRKPSQEVPRIEKHQKLSNVNAARICEVVDNYARYLSKLTN